MFRTQFAMCSPPWSSSETQRNITTKNRSRISKTGIGQNGTPCNLTIIVRKIVCDKLCVCDKVVCVWQSCVCVWQSSCVKNCVWQSCVCVLCVCDKVVCVWEKDCVWQVVCVWQSSCVKDGVWERLCVTSCVCVWKIVCAWQSCVCVTKIVRDKVAEAEEERTAGYRTKNENPTERCGELWSTPIFSWYLLVNFPTFYRCCLSSLVFAIPFSGNNHGMWGSLSFGHTPCSSRCLTST